jgi:hypothetical protein
MLLIPAHLLSRNPQVQRRHASHCMLLWDETSLQLTGPHISMADLFYFILFFICQICLHIGKSPRSNIYSHCPSLACFALLSPSSPEAATHTRIFTARVYSSFRLSAADAPQFPAATCCAIAHKSHTQGPALTWAAPLCLPHTRIVGTLAVRHLWRCHFSTCSLLLGTCFKASETGISGSHIALCPQGPLDGRTLSRLLPSGLLHRFLHAGRRV